MPKKVTASSKAFPTLSALVWLFPRVGSFVYEAADFITEGFAAHGAFVGLLSCVKPLVDNKRLFTSETLATGRAFMWLLPRVGSLMDDQVCPAIGDFPAVRTFIRFLFQWRLLVLGKVVRGRVEGFPTVISSLFPQIATSSLL